LLFGVVGELSVWMGPGAMLSSTPPTLGWLALAENGGPGSLRPIRERNKNAAYWPSGLDLDRPGVRAKVFITAVALGNFPVSLLEWAPNRGGGGGHAGHFFPFLGLGLVSRVSVLESANRAFRPVEVTSSGQLNRPIWQRVADGLAMKFGLRKATTSQPSGSESPRVCVLAWASVAQGYARLVDISVRILTKDAWAPHWIRT